MVWGGAPPLTKGRITKKEKNNDKIFNNLLRHSVGSHYNFIGHRPIHGCSKGKIMPQHSIEDLAMIQAMEKYGGSFVQALAQCFRHADYQNYRKLCYAFKDYCDQYRDMADQHIKKLKK